MSIQLSKETTDLFIQYISDFGDVVFLDSQLNHGFSYLAWQPEMVYQSNVNGDDFSLKFDLFTKSDNSWKFGFVSYDVKNYLEKKLKSKNSISANLPDLWFMIPKMLLKIDAKSNEAELILGEQETFLSELEKAKKRSFDKSYSISNWQSYSNKESYLQRIEEIKDAITEGSYYELNLSRLITADFTGSVNGLFSAFRELSPVPMAAFIKTNEWSICSASPEVFICKNGNEIISKPIKGTRKRFQDEDEDKKAKNELSESIKEKAENLMIVDLVRNDFNRICKPGSVSVKTLFDIKSYSTVHQMESTVIGLLKSDVNYATIFKAAFPMGSMTGAPKIASMLAIDSLENYKRNVYSGSIGYIDEHQNAEFNVVIRTAIIKDAKLYYSVGGAITADSIPEEEWTETETKAEILRLTMIKSQYPN